MTFAALAVAASLAWTTTASASSPVTVLNSGFEAPALADGNLGTAAVWLIVGGVDAGVWNPAATDYTAEAPEGSNVGYIFSDKADTGLSQVLAATFLADASYSLTVKVGHSNTYAAEGYRVQLLANGVVLAEDNNTLPIAANSFVTSTVNYTYNVADVALVGQPLEIRLLGKGLSVGGETDFDDVQLTVALGNPIAIPGGPYAVSVGGNLLLDGSASIPSEGATVTTYEWDLNNDGSYSEGVTGATPPAISQTTLTTVYGMSLGGNTIKLRITDSASKTSVSQTAVNILPDTPLIYEPFDYTSATLVGASGPSEKGFTGAWAASTDTKIGRNLTFGPLVTRGAGITDLQTGVNRFGGARAIDAATLASNGLLSDGATLWFSVIMGYDTGGNVSNSRLALCLATDSFATSNFSYYFTPKGAEGLGVTLGNLGGNGRIAATKFRDSTFGTGITGNQLGTLSSALFTAGQSGLIVGKITWGAASDTIEIYNVGTDLILPATPISTLTTSVNQAAFDTITWARGDKVLMDEIRFGGSYKSVIESGANWDLNGNVAGAGGASPSGTWNTDAIWNLAPDGTLVPIPWQAGGVAVFAAGNDATGPYTVTVNGTQDIGGIAVEEGTVNVTGGTALRMTKNTTVTVAPGLTATIGTPLSEDGSGRQMIKAGTGALILSGNNAAATGGMNLTSGVTQFESAASINGVARNVSIGALGTVAFGPGFGAANIPNAMLNRITAASGGAIAADNYAATGFDFNTPGLTTASLGAVGSVSYTGTLTPNGTTYRLGGGGGTLTMANTNALTGANSLIVNGIATLSANNDYTGTTTINGGGTLAILGTSATSGVMLNTPNTTLILGNDASLGSGAFTINNSFAGPGTVQAQGTVVTTNPVTANTDLNIGGTGTLTLGNVTVNTARIITNNNTTNTSTLGSISSTAAVALTFSGDGNTTVTGGIGGGSGITNLTKNGNGTLTLNNVNTYTGTTTVNNAGTLLVVSPGSLPAGAVTLNGTSTLGGTGTIGGNVTVTATANIAPGISVGILPITGNLNISAMAASTGVLKYELGSIGASDKITVGGTLTIGTGVLGLTDFVFTNVGGLQVGTYKLITSGAPVSGSVNGADSLGTVGSFNAELKITGNDLELILTAGTSPYLTWSGGAAANVDTNGDSVFNGVAWALNAADPNQNAIGLLPTLDNTSDATYAIFNYNRSGAANSDVNTTISVQYGTSLAGWTTAVDDGVNVIITVTPGSPTDFVQVKLKRSTLSVNGKLFARLNVVVAP
jgi:autotransporter-associated beta strand protein